MQTQQTNRSYTRLSKMKTLVSLVVPICVSAFFLVWVSGEPPVDAGVNIPNVTEACYRCLCHVSSGCDLNLQCSGGYCGPFNISRVYWADAGKVVDPTDDPERNHAWEDCAIDYNCAKKIVGAYLQNFVRDCNGDGVIDCYDYMMLNGNGGYACTAPLNRSANGRIWLKRYEECKLN
ncbi:hypothetical protein K1T71_009935 [Dendrolimus kikuchii]|uniref:Uncharacterized protein n=1 Tax=Dendrolimus kikuchii TaxID=765133 RepID=A0ACC1CT89_9NEOP|nr:hypothetical protein K1T71_009935 [Dendrolimus kikuchii]